MRRGKPIPRSAIRVGRSFSGLGLFAVAPIRRGDFIEYTGKIIDTKLADDLGGRYMFEINSKWTVNGFPRSNIARYINHSCKGNCESDTRGKRVLIFAKRKIRVGEELTYDYGEEYFDDYFKASGCKCPPCRDKPTKKGAERTKKTQA